MRRYSGDPFRLEVLTEESFVDGVFTISVIVIRLSCTAKTEWVIANDTERARSLYGIDKEEYLAMKEAQLQAWEEKIIAKLECPPDISYTITRAQGDIFTVVITEMTGGPKATAPPDKAATLTDRDVIRYLWLVDRKLSLLTAGIDWKPEYGPELEAIDKEIKELRVLIDQEQAKKGGG